MFNKRTITFLMKQNIEKLTMLANSALSEMNITDSQVGILFFLMEIRKGKPTPQIEIVNFFGLKHPTIVGLLKRLEIKDLIKLAKDNKDKRVVLVTPTKSALKLRTQLKKSMDRAHKDVYNGFSDDELLLLMDFMKRINKNIRS